MAGDDLREQLSAIAKQFQVFETEQEKVFSLFQSWIQQKFGVSSNQHWDRIILSSTPDEKGAVEQFFVLFDEFIRDRGDSELNSLTTSNPQIEVY